MCVELYDLERRGESTVVRKRYWYAIQVRALKFTVELEWKLYYPRAECRAPQGPGPESSGLARNLNCEVNFAEDFRNLLNVTIQM